MSWHNNKEQALHQYKTERTIIWNWADVQIQIGQVDILATFQIDHLLNVRENKFGNTYEKQLKRASTKCKISYRLHHSLQCLHNEELVKTMSTIPNCFSRILTSLISSWQSSAISVLDVKC